MLALTATADDRLAAITQAPVPEPLPSEAVVAVKACSLNPGEVRRLADLPAGAVTGRDFAGVVERGAADGSGPAVGTRVVASSTPARGPSASPARPATSGSCPTR